MWLSTLEIGRAQLDSVTEIALNLYIPNLLRQRKAFTLDTRNTCIAKPREARGGGGGAHKMSGMEGGENWSKVQLPQDWFGTRPLFYCFGERDVMWEGFGWSWRRRGRLTIPFHSFPPSKNQFPPAQLKNQTKQNKTKIKTNEQTNRQKNNNKKKKKGKTMLIVIAVFTNAIDFLRFGVVYFALLVDARLAVTF